MTANVRSLRAGAANRSAAKRLARGQRERCNKSTQQLSQPSGMRVDPFVTHAPSRPTHDARERATDDVLVMRLRRGEADAFESMYDAYRASIHSYFLRVARHEPTALELSQETWLRVATHARDLTADTRLRAWLFTVARNVFLSHRRWSLIDRDRLATFGLCAPRQEVPTPLDLACRSELERQLEQAIGALPPKYREILVLVTIEGFSPVEAGQILEISPPTFRKRLSRARALLEAALTDLAGGEQPAFARPTPLSPGTLQKDPEDEHVKR